MQSQHSRGRVKEFKTSLGYMSFEGHEILLQKNSNSGTGEVAERLKVHLVLAKDPSKIPRTYVQLL